MTAMHAARTSGAGSVVASLMQPPVGDGPPESLERAEAGDALRRRAIEQGIERRLRGAGSMWCHGPAASRARGGCGADTRDRNSTRASASA